MVLRGMIVVLLVAFGFLGAVAQERADLKAHPELLNEKSTSPDVPERVKACNQVFKNVQEGILANNISLFSSKLASQVYVNLRGGESGYFSENQVHYVLGNYLRSRKLANFEFTTVGQSESNPYATGSAIFIVKGTREIAQVYVSLSFVGERWAITQINIY